MSLMHSGLKLLRRDTELLHGNATPEVLGFCRVVVFSVWLVLLLNSPLPQLAGFPAEWLSRWGFLGLVPRSLLVLLLDPVALWGIYITMCALCVLAIFGARPYTPLALALVGCLTLYEALTKGFGGYPNHAQAAVLYCAWILAIFPAADGLSILGRKRVLERTALYQAPMVAMVLVVTFTYMVIGLRRFVSGGLDIFTSDTILNYIAARSAEYSTYGFEYGTLLFGSASLVASLKFGYFVTTIFEMLAPLCLFNRWFRYLWLVVIGFFHVASLLTMNIFFWENLFLFAVLLTPLPYLFARQNSLPGQAGTTEKSPSPSGQAAAPLQELPLPVLFYDGECGLCNGFVQWVLKRDHQARFHFSTLQGELAARVIGAPQGPWREWSVVLADKDGLHRRSDAAIRTIAGLGGLWSFANLFRLIPRLFRDTVYEFVARNRYRWFGKVDACRLPTVSERARFLS